MSFSLPVEQCFGCDGCGLRCTEGVKMTLHEFEMIRAFLRSLPPGEVERVLTQDKRVRVAEGWEVWACRFRDTERGRCLIYPVRPLICRLFGVVDFLPCPIGRAGRRVEDVGPILRWYSSFERRTFGDWARLFGDGPLCLGEPPKGEVAREVGRV